MKLGIIGLPQSGKTTVFEALTHSFSDMGKKGEARVGTIAVPDTRLDRLSEMYRPKKTTPAQVEYLLPGPGGKSGDSNLWSQVRECDALLHVVGNYSRYADSSPCDARNEMDQEMMLADLMVVEKRIERMKQDRRKRPDFNEKEYDLLVQCHQHLEAEVPLRCHPQTAMAPELRGYALVTGKPMLIVYNNEDEDEKAPQCTHAAADDPHLVMRARLEHELAQMSPEDADEFLREFHIQASAMDRVIQGSYALQGLISFFTVGPDEVRAWTIRKKTCAVDAAGVIHSDISKGFIRAEVVFYEDLMQAGSHSAARQQGTVRLEGKTYPVEDGDIIHFRFNV